MWTASYPIVISNLPGKIVEDNYTNSLATCTASDSCTIIPAKNCINANKKKEFNCQFFQDLPQNYSSKTKEGEGVINGFSAFFMLKSLTLSQEWL